MSDIASFAERMRRRGLEVEEGVNTVVREVALVADRELVLTTPVDTGRARSNWQVSLGAPIPTTRDPYAPGAGGATAGPNAQAAIAQGAATVSARRPQQDIHITNNLPYIGRLNDGWSAQAPAGFVQAAIRRAVNIVGRVHIFGTGRIR